VETQEAEGMRLPGMFRDLNNPDRFVWLRGFADMPSRAAGLQAFYTGPAWKANARAANGTMIDSDNVLLLRPTGPGAGFALDGLVRPPGRRRPGVGVDRGGRHLLPQVPGGQRADRTLRPESVAPTGQAARPAVHAVRGEHLPRPAGAHRRACACLVLLCSARRSPGTVARMGGGHRGPAARPDRRSLLH